MRAVLACLLAVLALLAAPPPSAAADRPLVVLVSIDAFRPDYLDRGVTPVLSALAARGVRAAMRPSFPSKTFPNHYALVTGLPPDRNGIVANNMWDDAKPGVTFSMSNRAAVQDGDWWGQAEPIWVTAERAGMITAPVYWPGSEAAIQGVRPRYARLFDANRDSPDRVDDLLALLDRSAPERPQFLTLYMDTVDTAGHKYGPRSPEVNAAIAGADAAVGQLLAGLRARGLDANVIVVADHGMAEVSPDRAVYIDDLLAKGTYRTLDLGPIGTIWPQPGHEAEVARTLTAKRPHLQCWRKADIPARFHYGQNPRVAPVFCLPQTGWVLTTRDYKPKEGPQKGEHGYDNRSPEMAAVFLAAGPAFRPGVRLTTFDNVSVYPLLAKLLGVEPRPNDGRLADTAKALR